MWSRSMGSRSYWIPDDLGLQAVHQRPFVANEDKVIVGRRGVIEAWGAWHRLEINPPHAYAALLFDVDHPAQRGWVDPPWYGHGLPKILPSWVVHNFHNGHMHVGYALDLPVARHDNARLGPQRYAARVADRLSLYLGADPGYRGLIHRNPVNPGPDCEVWQPQLWLATHTLAALDKAIPKSIRPTRIRGTGLGRNVDLFSAMVKEVHRPRWADALAHQGWREFWLDHVRGQNVAMFPGAELPDSECRSIAKSCYRYWTKQYDPSRFKDLQVKRNAKRWHGTFDYDFEARDASILSLAQVGFNQREIAEIVELTTARVGQVIKKVKSHNSSTPSSTPTPSQKGKADTLAYLPTDPEPRPVTSWRVVKGCTLCDQDNLHNPGPVLCIRCGVLSVDSKEKHHLPHKDRRN